MRFICIMIKAKWYKLFLFETDWCVTINPLVFSHSQQLIKMQTVIELSVVCYCRSIFVRKCSISKYVLPVKAVSLNVVVKCFVVTA